MPNGSYAPQHGFDQQQANNAYASQNYNQAPAASSNSASTATPQPEIPKDEVGWYFVEQYYTTLSRTPEKLYVSCGSIGIQDRAMADTQKTALLQQAIPIRVRKRDREGQRLHRPEGKQHSSTNFCAGPDIFLLGDQRQDKGAGVPGLQGPHHKCRLPGIRHQHCHPGHWRDLQQVAASQKVHSDLRSCHAN
jgi:hypothetical protein